MKEQLENKRYIRQEKVAEYLNKLDRKKKIWEAIRNVAREKRTLNFCGTS
jgi:hypothetical protein